MFKKNNFTWLIVGLVVASIASIFIGAYSFSLSDLLAGDTTQLMILLDSRLPRLLAVLITGASLSVAGSIMQTLSNNKFVSPSTMGVMEWAKLGMMLSLLFLSSGTIFERMLFAGVTAMLGTFLFMGFISKIKIKDPIMLPLIGMMLGNVVSAISTFIAYRFNLVQNMSAWMQGNFGLIVSGRYELLWIGLPIVIVAYFYAREFTIVGLGKETSKNLGLSFGVISATGLILVALLTSSVVVTVGTIPFVGLIIPNIVSIFKGDHLRTNLPWNIAIGALFLLGCDLLSRTLIAPYELPVGVVVSVVGSVIFLFVLGRSQKNG
ncbi:MAG: ABC transporter permease [Erysipelotrichaceae bacterium]